MAIITKGAASKGASTQITLSKSDLRTVSKVVSDAYYSVIANWNKVLVNFKSTTGGQKKTASFNAAEGSPVASISFSSTARDAFEIFSIVISDFDGGSLTISKEDLGAASADFDISLTPAVSLATLFQKSFAGRSDVSPMNDEIFNNGVDTVTFDGSKMVITATETLNQQVDFFNQDLQPNTDYKVTLQGMSFSGFGEAQINVAGYGAEVITGSGDRVFNITTGDIGSYRAINIVVLSSGNPGETATLSFSGIKVETVAPVIASPIFLSPLTVTFQKFGNTRVIYHSAEFTGGRRVEFVVTRTSTGVSLPPTEQPQQTLPGAGAYTVVATLYSLNGTALLTQSGGGSVA